MPLPYLAGSAMKISTRIFTLVAFCLALLGAVSSISIWQMLKVSQELEGIAHRYIPLTEKLTNITIHQLEQAINFERAFRSGQIMSDHPKTKSEYTIATQKFKDLTGKLEQEFSAVQAIARHSLDTALTSEERHVYQGVMTQFGNLHAKHGSYDRLSRQAFELIEARNLEKALGLLPKIEIEEESLDKQLEQMLVHVENFTKRAAETAVTNEHFAHMLLLVITGVTIFMGTIVAFFIVRRNISQPLSEIVTALETLSSGDMSCEVKVYNDDEIGAIVKAYALFKTTMMNLKQREQELEASLHFKTLVENTNVVPWEFDPVTMRYTYIGPQANELFGYPLERWYSDNFFAEMIHPDDREEAVHFCMSATKECKDHNFEYRALTAEGGIIWVRDVVSVVSENGAATGLRGILIDITEKKNSEAALRESEQRFKDIAEVSSDWIWECDENLRFTYLSERFSQVAGVSTERLLGKTRHEIGKDIIADWDTHIAVQEARKPFRAFDYSIKDDNGDTRHWVTSGRPVFDADGKFTGYRGTGSDRTAEVRVQAELVRHRDHLQEMVNNATMEIKEQALELSEALTKEKELNELQRQFVSMASHEFRTPLAIIDATAQRMKSRADDNNLTPEDAVQRVEKIRTAVNRMTRLMDSTLSAARMEKGKIEIEIDQCDIREIILEVCTHQQDIAKSHVISSNLEDLPASIQADAGALEQVLTNLLSNAVKYAPDAPAIDVIAHTEDDHVIIQVCDHGIGIDEDDLDKIGDRFFRARTSMGIAGTGIGLNLVKMLVELHGGIINIKSTKGEGSTFTIRLPIAGPEQPGQSGIKVA